MNLKDRQKLEMQKDNDLNQNKNVVENEKQENLMSITDTSKQLLEEMTQALKMVTEEQDQLRIESKQKEVFYSEEKCIVGRKGEQSSTGETSLYGTGNSIRRRLDYTKKELSQEKEESNWLNMIFCEKEGEIDRLKNTPLWKKIWQDIKPKRSYGANYY